jgi:hypothetical protein
MMMYEALAKTDDGVTWARPIAARGWGYGYVYDRNGLLAIVPGSRGARAVTIRRRDIEGEWEAVHSDVILDERKEPSP